MNFSECDDFICLLGTNELENILFVIVTLFAGMLTAHMMHRETVVQKRLMREQYFSELKQWADETVSSLSEAVHLCDLDPNKCAEPSFFNRRHDLRVIFSALIDRGRWFFPNVEHVGIGQRSEEFIRANSLKS
uniref:Uncharacterized protein n=1 Tax=Candidatus Kentrum sp. FW TaxID=2126338 RepID=A0A450SB61_9GAMM|nr:MAG: hypothetical protein BECKFW1821B_GA0114236_100538 [Candidatus Kentron sp. FW]VFJ56968.1 MAG: hypothetical protein BECKFW1821A_GA0114235_10664 [Candidatus Kentron sp. FW]